MRDARFEQLAELLVNHSCRLQPGETVIIEAINIPHSMVRELLRSAKRAGGTPVLWLKDDRLLREFALLYDEAEYRRLAETELAAMRAAHAFIGLRGGANAQEYADIPPERLKTLLDHYVRPVHHRYRSQKMKWVALRWPTPAMAQRAGMSTDAFEDYYFDVCLLDYARLDRAMTPLAELMDRTDQVRIVGPGETDLTFSIAGIACKKCTGANNIPDGEILTSPIRDSVSGVIGFNIPTIYYGTAFSDIRLKFEDGRVTLASANDSRRLNELLDQDEGARFVGEFAFGVHPRIRQPIQDILFDEKIAGSVHLAMGNAYDVADNGNRSAIHWDLILDQTAACGGGEVWFDGRLVRKDGMFVIPELEGLNPEALADV